MLQKQRSVRATRRSSTHSFQEVESSAEWQDRSSSGKMTFNRLLTRAVLVSRVGSRSVFTSSKPDLSKPSWFRVGLAFGSSVVIWGLLFQQHSTDVHEYKVRNGLE
ncbi:NADH dehydrogenase [ubiquinone] 1 subunit C1, mitochondrial [Dicentrarchus labrax]|uniref:NADH dehydrogenase [ubiquinone] 1 subunit C1, mitochondrial n=1 Tax=Dicentrarchus labrax TaxID=13489 RepID=UPI0021F5704E|nr:NADH dehydrogenase [ubiquinone] 1 subunit C1, mitochondrial [Dicentrarchus labrax]